MKRSFIPVVAVWIGLAATIFLSGCAGPVTRANGAGANADNSEINSLYQDKDGNVSSLTNGVPPRQSVLNAQTLNSYQSGQGTVAGLVLDPSSPRLLLDNPGDTTIHGLRVTMGATPSIQIDELISSHSKVIEAYNQQVVATLQLQGAITQAQADAIKQALATGADLGSALVKALVKP